MLKISIDKDKGGSTIEINGSLIDILNDSLNAVGMMNRELEKIGGPRAAAMFIRGIPAAIMEYHGGKVKEAEPEKKKEDEKKC